MCRRPPGVHYALGNAFVIEVRDLLAEMKIVHQRGPAAADLQRVIGLGEALTLCRGEEIAVLRRTLLTLGARIGCRAAFVVRRTRAPC